MKIENKKDIDTLLKRALIILQIVNVWIEIIFELLELFH
jgi:hypothetical protein